MPTLVSRGSRRRTINEINMVPFIDVMLVLLIIFMVTAPLITPSVIDLPSVGAAGRTPEQKIEIVIGKDEQITLKTGDRSRQVAFTDLADIVRRAQREVPAGASAVVISADKNIRYESVIKVMDSLQRSGVQRVGLSVQLAR